MKSRGDKRKFEFVLVTRVFSCGGDVCDDASSFSLFFVHLYLMWVYITKLWLSSSDKRPPSK